MRVLLCQLALLALGLVGINSAGLGIDYLRTLIQPGVRAVDWPLGLIPPAAWSPLQVLLAISAFLLASSLLRGAIQWLNGVLVARLVHRHVISRLQKAVFAKLQHLDFRFFDRHNRGEIINRATGDISAIRSFVDGILVQSVVTMLTIVVYVGFMLSIHVGLTIACLAPVPIIAYISARYSRGVHPLHLENRNLFDRLVLTLAEGIEGIHVVKGFARERDVATRFRSENEALRHHQKKIFWRASLFTPGIDLLSQAGLVILLLYGGKLVIDGTIALGTGLIVFAALIQQFGNQVTQLAQIANGIQESLTGARRVFEILDAPAGLPERPLAAEPVSRAGSVRFENVGFRHVPGGPDVLRDVSFEISPGECIAIVGETGSGKSALLNLIPRFYDPAEGRVVVEGVDVRDWDLQALRRRVGIVFQENFLFSDTVAANIAFGRPDADRADVVAAAEAARAHDFVTALPEGYETILGEAGVDISGGQRQRLTIARALLSNPSILLLDDPTASIDPETEHEILAAIDRSLSGRTTFVVAHRLSTLRRADRVLVLEHGRIVQTGTHAELIRQTGPYRSAALHQMVDEESRRLLADDLPPESAHPPAEPSPVGLVPSPLPILP